MKRKYKLMEAYSTYDHETTWKQIRKAGNSSLFNDNEEYKAWKAQEESCTLVYAGKLGSGKTVLFANIVDDLHLNAKARENQIAYYFCRHDVAESLKARTILGCLARQILAAGSYLADNTELSGSNVRLLDMDAVSKLLEDSLSQVGKAFLILDGLDECDSTEKHSLLERPFWIQKTTKVLLCFSFTIQSDSSFGALLDETANLRVATMPDRNTDIEAFIDAELDECIASKKLVVGSSTIVYDIRNALLSGSEGMFLWVVLQINSLCNMKSDYDIRQALEDLPKDLSETFSRILDRSKGSGEHYQKRILEFMMAAFRPLTLGELQDALGVVPKDTDWNPERLPNDIYSVLGCCGSLVTIDEEEFDCTTCTPQC